MLARRLRAARRRPLAGGQTFFGEFDARRRYVDRIHNVRGTLRHAERIVVWAKGTPRPPPVCEILNLVSSCLVPIAALSRAISPWTRWGPATLRCGTRSSASPPDAHTPRSSPCIAARRSGSTISTEAGGIAEPRHSFPKIRRHAMSCHHNLDEYLIGYLDGDELGDDPKGRCSVRWAAAPAAHALDAETD